MSATILVLGAVSLIVFIPMLVEARRAAANERALFARGGIEPAGDVYRAMQVVYPAAFLAMIAEGAARGDAAPSRVFAAGLMTFVAAKAVKWWAVSTLGPRWTFRVVVLPAAPRIATGPYRFVRHPNYVGVAGELIGVWLMTGAIVSGPIAIAVFGALLARRIAVEDRALGGTLARETR
jgi:methyltransferase